MSKPFHFKQFTIHQDKCTMKVGTDGMLLGAWTDVSKAKTILDIGTGTGIISLMLAQRNKEVKIKALEIEANSAQQANENFKACPWSDRLECQHLSVQAFTQETSQQFDLIVSNPPFFPAEHFTEARDASRQQARNDVSLTFEDLISTGNQLMHDESTFNLIIPYSEKKRLFRIAKAHHLFCNRLTRVKPKKDKEVRRLLLEFSKFETDTKVDELIIQHEARNDYTEDYRKLTAEFHTIF